MKKIISFKRNKLNLYKWMFLAIMAGIYIVSCNKINFGNNVAVLTTPTSGITLNISDTFPMLIGKDTTISFIVTPDSASNSEIDWVTSDSSVATVNKGVVTAKSNGFATITASATDGTNNIASTIVNVIDHVTQITSITFTNTPSDTALYQGDSYTIGTQILPAKPTYKTLNWTSSDTSVVAVSSSGIIKCKNYGTAIITASSTDGGGAKASVNITVEQVIAVQTISFNSDTAILGQNEVAKMSYTVTPANATTTNLEWTSSNTSVITVADGIVTVKGSGTAIVTVKSPNTGVTDSIFINAPLGYLNDDFSSPTAINYWGIQSYGKSASIVNGTLQVTNEEESWATGYYIGFLWRSDLVINPSTYPIMAFKVHFIANPKYGVGFDTYKGTWNTNTAYSDNSTNTYVYYCDMTTMTSLSYTYTGTTTFLQDFSSPYFDFKAGDMPDALTYNIDWIKTFPSVNSLQEYITNN